MSFNVEAIRNEFPVLSQEVQGKPLVYFDSAASMQKPHEVIKSISDFYSNDYSNVHRGLHTLSERATKMFEDSRAAVKSFLNAGSEKEIVFVRGATEAINLVAESYARATLKPGDEILISTLEHHANIVPWQVVCQKTGAVLKVIKLHDDGSLDQAHFDELLSEKTKLMALSHVSNAIGTINPVKEMISKAKSFGAKVLIDGAQAVHHMPVDVQDLACDFYVFSSHKCYGPTGVGVLFAKHELLEKMQPYQTGGDMIKRVTFEKTTYNEAPSKFEAGTPNIAGVIGLHAAIKFITNIGFDTIAAHEADLLKYATEQLDALGGITIIGTAQNKASLVSFVMDNAHSHDVGTILDSEGLAVRAGHHCAMPLMDYYGLAATARASFAIYNTKAEIDVLVTALDKVKRLFAL